MNAELNRLVNWPAVNKLSLNKSKTILFRYKTQHSTLFLTLNLTLPVLIPDKTKVKFLFSDFFVVP